MSFVYFIKTNLVAQYQFKLKSNFSQFTSFRKGSFNNFMMYALKVSRQFGIF